jgi:MFS family permease
VILGVITVPLHGLILRSPATGPLALDEHAPELSVGPGEALRSAAFWRLSGAFFLATVTGIAMTVHAIPFLLQRGYGAGFAAFAVGLVGLSQIPGRLLFVPVANRLPRAQASASVFILIAAGIAFIVSIDASSAVPTGLVLLGMGNGMATLARATAIADLYGAGAYGTIAGVTGAMTTAARGVGPVTGALWAAAVGYSALLWTLVALSALAAVLAYRADSG